MATTDTNGGGIRATAVRKSCTTNRPPSPGLRAALHGLLAPERTTTDVDVVVEPGELVMLLGPNGARKSTLITVLTGIVSATSGGSYSAAPVGVGRCMAGTSSVRRVGVSA